MATDQSYRRTWAIQVKTNRKAAKFWLLNKSYGIDVSPTHVYIFVNLRGKERPEYYIVPSKIVARDGFTSTSGTGSIWYAYDIRKAKAERYRENWGIFDALPQSE